MSAEPTLLTRSWRIGAYTATISVPRLKEGEPVFASVEWSPSQPRSLSGKELALYRHHRNLAIAEIASELGIPAAVLDL